MLQFRIQALSRHAFVLIAVAVVSKLILWQPSQIFILSIWANFPPNVLQFLQLTSVGYPFLLLLLSGFNYWRHCKWPLYSAALGGGYRLWFVPSNFF